jgi:hypothetical protein
MLPFLTFGNFILLKEKNDQKGPLREYSKIKGSSFCSGKFMVPMTAKIWVKSHNSFTGKRDIPFPLNHIGILTGMYTIVYTMK